MRRLPLLCGVLPLALILSGVAWPCLAQDDLTPLSDEFSDASRIGEWNRIHLTEGWNADQLETWDVDTSQAGRMVLVPYTVSWFEEWRGPLVYKNVSGDFVFTVEVHPRGRDGVSVPGRLYSLAGVMVRTPRAITNPATDWSPGGENYVFLSLGRASGASPGYEFEVKTTITSNSNLAIDAASGDHATLQVARIGNVVLCLRRVAGGNWEVHRRFLRTDMPTDLQVGMVAYTDWPNVSPTDPYTHNSSVLIGPPNQPDLIAGYEYARYARPLTPPAWQSLDLTNPAQVSDAELLAVLGDNANPVPTAAPSSRAMTIQMRSAYPNPFNPTTTLSLDVERPTDAKVVIFDSAGRRVRDLAARRFERGEHRLRWDGRDNVGAGVASGVYVARLVSLDGPGSALRLVLVR